MAEKYTFIGHPDKKLVRNADVDNIQISIADKIIATFNITAYDKEDALIRVENAIKPIITFLNGEANVDIFIQRVFKNKTEVHRNCYIGYVLIDSNTRFNYLVNFKGKFENTRGLYCRVPCFAAQGQYVKMDGTIETIPMRIIDDGVPFSKYSKKNYNYKEKKNEEQLKKKGKLYTSQTVTQQIS